jgi:hypothetical protein
MRDLLQIDPIELEVGYSLIPLVDEGQGGDLLERIGLLRKQAALELGILVPAIRIRDDIRLPANEYVIKLRGSEVALPGPTDFRKHRRRRDLRERRLELGPSMPPRPIKKCFEEFCPKACLGATS